MTSASLIDWKVFNVTDPTYLTNLTMRAIDVFYFYFFNATVLCKRNEKELRRNSGEIREFPRTNCKLSFQTKIRRNFGASIVLVPTKFQKLGVEPNAKFRRTFARTKYDIRPTSLLLLLHSTVVKRSRKKGFNFKKA